MATCDIRFAKLFGQGKKAVVVACDHGMFDGPHEGMEDIAEALKKLGDDADGILLSPGMLEHAKSYFCRKNVPVPIVRINFNSVFCSRWNYKESSITSLFQPEDAVALGADFVLVCLTLKTGSEDRDARNTAVFADLCVKAHKLGVPVVGEYFPHSHQTKTPDEFHEEIMIGCRMLAELGADCIKTFYTRNFKEITRTCPIPVLGLGAEKTPTDRGALELAEREMNDGASGVVFGRNALQASNPKNFVAALQDIVKRGAKPGDLVKKYNLTG